MMAKDGYSKFLWTLARRIPMKKTIAPYKVQKKNSEQL